MNFEDVKALVDEQLDRQDSGDMSSPDISPDISPDRSPDRSRDIEDTVLENDDDDEEEVEEDYGDYDSQMSRSMRSSDTSFFVGTPLRPNSDFCSVLEYEDLTDADSDYII